MNIKLEKTKVGNNPYAIIDLPDEDGELWKKSASFYKGDWIKALNYYPGIWSRVTPQYFAFIESILPKIVNVVKILVAQVCFHTEKQTLKELILKQRKTLIKQQKKKLFKLS